MFPYTNMMDYYGYGFGGIGLLLSALWWVLIVVVIVALARWLSKTGQSAAEDKSSLEILKERYAKGEIDKREFEEKKRDLKEN